MPVIKEVQAIMTLMSEFYPKQKFYLSFACNSPTTLGSGEPFVDAVKEIIKYKELCKIAAIGWLLNSNTFKFDSNEKGFYLI